MSEYLDFLRRGFLVFSFDDRRAVTGRAYIPRLDLISFFIIRVHLWMVGGVSEYHRGGQVAHFFNWQFSNV